MATLLKGCKRGVFGLDSWDPVEIPESLLQKLKTQGAASTETRGAQKATNQENNSSKKTAVPPTDIPKANEKIAAKYTYNANTSSPIGHELSLTPGAKLKFLKVAECNGHWWYCENEEGEEGYIPASYVMTIRVTSLPWLQNKEPESEPTPTKVQFKPYIPTYDLRGVAHGSDKHHCKVCEKYFNGPQPYNAHMNSKAHKEEVEIAEAYNH